MSSIPDLKNNQATRQITTNTIVLFARMLFIFLANLYVVRLVVNGMGQTDWGIFTSVSSVVTVMSFLSSVLALSSQRFISIAIGEGNILLQKKIFSASINIAIVISILLIVIYESYGIWFVEEKMIIPVESTSSVRWLFHFLLGAFVLSIAQVPYTAVMFAHEDMRLYTIISFVECFGKIVISFFLGKLFCDNLIFYSGALFALTLVISAMYSVFISRRYSDCHYVIDKDFSIYYQLLKFSGWTSLGSLSNSAMVQGTALLLNLFFGPIASGAYGISLQILNAFNTFTSSLVLPFRPVMMKNYARKNFDYMWQLFGIQNRIMLYILLVIGIPLFSEMEVILKLWLGEVTPMIVLFSRLIIIYVIFMSLHNPITILIHSSGNVKRYHLVTEGVTLLTLPLDYLLLRMGFDSFWVIIMMIMTCIIAHIARLFILYQQDNTFGVKAYILSSFVYPGIIISISLLCIYLIKSFMPDSLAQSMTVMMVIPCIIMVSGYLWGLNRDEKSAVRSLFLKKLSV